MKKNNGNSEPAIKNENRKPRFRRFFPRGGAIVEISGISVKIIAKVAIKFIAEKGLLAGLTASSGVAIRKIPASAISTYLRDAFAQNLPELEKKKFILVKEEKIYLDQYDQSIKYLFEVLKDGTIPFEEKKN